MSSEELIKALRNSGCKFVREGKGSHEIWYSPITNKTISVPSGKKDMPIGTLRAIKKTAGV